MKRLDIESELLELGAPAGRQGYIQMVTALEFIMQHDDVMCAAANLYPYVAEQLNTVPPRVERNIREEIYAIWSRGNQDRLNACAQASPRKGEAAGLIFSFRPLF